MTRTQTIHAGDRPVLVVIRDAETGAILAERPMQAGEAHDFIVEDGVVLDAEAWDGTAHALRQRYDPAIDNH